MLLTLIAACFKTVVVQAVMPSRPEPARFPHEIFDRVLQKHVNDAGLVDYRGLAADRADLDLYVAYIAGVSPTHDPDLFPSRQDQEAYYLNAYNALAISGVIDRPGLKSVEDNLADFFYLTKYVMGTEPINLYDLENKVVRATFKDPRIHFALNCQSGGCPRLVNHAYMPATLEAELDAGAKEFATHPAKVNIDAAGVVHISQIFEWYKEDFESAGGPVAYINSVGGSVPADAKVEIIPYDWSLSCQPDRGP